MFARKPILDRRPLQNTLVVVALGIAVVMLTPQLSPVLGDVDLLALVRTDRFETTTELRFGTVPPEERPSERRQPVKAKGIYMSGYTAGGYGDFGGRRF